MGFFDVQSGTDTEERHTERHVKSKDLLHLQIPEEGSMAHHSGGHMEGVPREQLFQAGGDQDPWASASIEGQCGRQK